MFFYYTKQRYVRVDTKCSLDVHLCSSPVSSLGVVADFVVSSQTDPLGQRSVLLLGLSQLLLDSK